MNILVCIKQVPDTGTRIQLLKNKKGIDESGIEWIINPYDEFALEEALQIKEKASDIEVVVLSLGPARAEKALRTALAMGADRACLIESPIETEAPLDPSISNKSPCLAAWALSQIIKKEQNWQLILTGKGGIDENHCATGPMLAEQLQIPHVGFVTGMKQQEGTWLCERNIEEGIKEEITLTPPALITVDKGINEPRYPSLPGIMKAKKKPLKKISLSDLKPPSDLPTWAFHSYCLPSPPLPPQMIPGTAKEQAKELIRLLKEKEKIL